MEKLEYLPNGQWQLTKSDKPTDIGKFKADKEKAKDKAESNDIRSQLDDAMRSGIDEHGNLPEKPKLSLVKPKPNLSIVKD